MHTRHHTHLRYGAVPRFSVNTGEIEFGAAAIELVEGCVVMANRQLMPAQTKHNYQRFPSRQTRTNPSTGNTHVLARLMACSGGGGGTIYHPGTTGTGGIRCRPRTRTSFPTHTTAPARQTHK